MKIAIVVHGRFHAFHLTRELLRQGQDATLFTNYPAFVVEKFGVPRGRVKSFLLHGVLSRALDRISSLIAARPWEAFLHSLFSKWAAAELAKEEWDTIHIFSGVAEDTLASTKIRSRLILLARSSTHIAEQRKILDDEEARTGSRLDKPSDWMIAREEREYRLADSILVLSSFNRETFVRRGVDPAKVETMPLGVDIGRFEAGEGACENRRQRILSGKPLRVLMVGAFSLRKGAYDLLRIAEAAGNRFEFRFVGEVLPETRPFIRRYPGVVHFVPKQPEYGLPPFYADADIFIFPTLEDGYPVVLAQAQASGLPLLASSNCSASDFVREGETGWILPPRNPAAFLEKLVWCDAHRPELAEVSRRVREEFRPRDWSRVARDFTGICEKRLKGRVLDAREAAV